MELSREVSKAKDKSKAKRVRGIKSISFSGFLVYIVLPLIPILVFWFIPMIASFLLSLTDWDYVSPTFNVVGAQNYKDILSSDAFWQALKNTLLFGLGTVVPTLIFGFLMAILIDKFRRGKELIQGFLFAPWITPMVAMSIVWSWMFRPDIGLINRGLAIFGISGPNWLTDSNTALIAVMIVTVWKTSGWCMLYYADAISKIPKDLFEAYELEGSSVWQKIKYIYMPMTAKTTLFLAVISLINSIQAYDQISVLTRGGPAGSTRTLLYLFYQMAFEQFNMGKATTVTMIMVVITGILAGLMFILQKKFANR